MDQLIPADDLNNFKNLINDFYRQFILIQKYPNCNLDYYQFENDITTFIINLFPYEYSQFDNYEKNIIDCCKYALRNGDFKKTINSKRFHKKLLKIYPNHQG